MGVISEGAHVAQIADAVWMSMLLSAFAGILAVTVVVATFYFIRCAWSPPQLPCISPVILPWTLERWRSCFVTRIIWHVTVFQSRRLGFKDEG